jgi:hypothetical protein
MPHPAEILLDALGKTTLTTQTFRDAPTATGYPTVAHGPHAAQRARLTAANQAGMGVFFMVNDGNCEGRRAENVTSTVALFIDLDGNPIPTNLPLEPTAIVTSSPDRHHVYWRVTGAPPDEWTHAQKHLAEMLGGDPVVHDLPRVLRLPGYEHRKRDPYLVTLTHVEPLAEYEWPLFRDLFRVPPPPPPPRPLPDAVRAYIDRKRNGASRGPQGLQNRTLDTAGTRVASAPEGQRNRTLYRVAAAVAAQVKAGEINAQEAERQLTLAGLAAGLEEHEIRASLRSAMRYAK